MSHILTGILSGLLGMLIGSLLTHRFAIGREKRKEHNEVVIPLKSKVLKLIDTYDSRPDCDGLSKCDVETIRLNVSDSLYNIIKNEHEMFSMLMNKSINVTCFGDPYVKEENIPILLGHLNKINSLLKVK